MTDVNQQFGNDQCKRKDLPTNSYNDDISMFMHKQG